MVNVKKNIITHKKAEEENSRSNKNKELLNNNKIRKEILTEKQALKKPIGSYYHPDENTWRSGACPKGQILKKGYKRKSYVTKTGKVIPEMYVNPVCIKDKGKIGKNINKKTITKKVVNNIKKNNKPINNKPVNNKPVNNKPVNNIKKNNKPVNNIKKNNKPVNNIKKNNKPVNNIKQSNIQELTNNMIINLMKNNKL